MKQLIFFLLVTLTMASCGQTKKKTKLADCLMLVEMENGKFGVETVKGDEVLPVRYDSLRLQLNKGADYYITAYSKSMNTETLFYLWYNGHSEPSPVDSLFTYPSIITYALDDKSEDGDLWIVRNEQGKYVFIEKIEKRDVDGNLIRKSWQKRQRLNDWDKLYSLRGINSDDNKYRYLVKRDGKCAILDVRNGGYLKFPEIFEDIVVVVNPGTFDAQLRFLCRRLGAKKYELYDHFYDSKLERRNGKWYLVSYEVENPICYFTQAEIDTITAEQSGPIYRYNEGDRLTSKLETVGFKGMVKYWL